MMTTETTSDSRVISLFDRSSQAAQVKINAKARLQVAQENHKASIPPLRSLDIGSEIERLMDAQKKIEALIDIFNTP
ncbi:MAG: hypothetical protein KTR14_10840 [Vampirovibrio sp.]|nr:hypothetical protein [Vampirovibrio sp.]